MFRNRTKKLYITKILKKLNIKITSKNLKDLDQFTINKLFKEKGILKYFLKFEKYFKRTYQTEVKNKLFKNSFKPLINYFNNTDYRKNKINSYKILIQQ